MCRSSMYSSAKFPACIRAALHSAARHLCLQLAGLLARELYYTAATGYLHVAMVPHGPSPLPGIADAVAPPAAPLQRLVLRSGILDAGQLRQPSSHLPGITQLSLSSYYEPSLAAVLRTLLPQLPRLADLSLSGHLEFDRDGSFDVVEAATGSYEALRVLGSLQGLTHLSLHKFCLPLADLPGNLRCLPGEALRCTSIALHSRPCAHATITLRLLPALPAPAAGLLSLSLTDNLLTSMPPALLAATALGSLSLKDNINLCPTCAGVARLIRAMPHLRHLDLKLTYNGGSLPAAVGELVRQAAPQLELVSIGY